MNNQKDPSCKDNVEPGVISVAEAVANILQSTKVINNACKLSIRETHQSIISADILSPLNVPPHDNSAMDGYALNTEDLPKENTTTFQVIGTAFAGKPYEGKCKQGECVRIMTGAMLPDKTDCIVIQEDTTSLENGVVEIGAGHKKNQNIRFAGEDIKVGAVVLGKGRQVTAADLGVMASLGIAETEVYKKPKVSFFSTGDEIKSIGEELKKGEIYDSNRFSLFGMLSDCNVDIIDMGVVKDDPDSIRKALLSAAQSSDVILTSGGVSVGEADYIKPILEEIGSINFWKIAMKPGRPLTFGAINDCLFFGLPGNPVAVMVTFYQFVLPCLKKLSGKKQQTAPLMKAICEHDIKKNTGRTEFQRGIAYTDDEGNLRVKTTGRQGSGILTSMSQANCFIVLPESCGNVNIGDAVDLQLFISSL